MKEYVPETFFRKSWEVPAENGRTPLTIETKLQSVENMPLLRFTFKVGGLKGGDGRVFFSGQHVSQEVKRLKEAARYAEDLAVITLQRQLSETGMDQFLCPVADDRPQIARHETMDGVELSVEFKPPMLIGRKAAINGMKIICSEVAAKIDQCLPLIDDIVHDTRAVEIIDDDAADRPFEDRIKEKDYGARGRARSDSITETRRPSRESQD